MSHVLISNCSDNFFIALFSQGHLRRHRKDLLLPDPGPVEGDPLPEVAVPGVLGLPAEEPSPCRHPEAGGQAVLRRTRGWRCKTDEILMWEIQQQLFIVAGCRT